MARRWIDKLICRWRLFRFDRSYYLANNPDVRESGMPPEHHFLRYGCSAGRKRRLGAVPTVSTRQSLTTLLVLDRTVPVPEQDSGSVRMMEILGILRGMGWRVVFIAHHVQPGAAPGIQKLRSLGIPFLQGMVDAKAFCARNRTTLRNVWISRPSVARDYLPILHEMGVSARIVYDTVDLHFVRLRREAELSGDEAMRRQADEAFQMEQSAISQADRVLTVTDVEKNVILRTWPGTRVSVLSNIHRVSLQKAPFRERSGLLFIGGFAHRPNLDAVLWFVHDVLPLLQTEIPDLVFTVVGSNPPKEIKALQSPSVRIAGFLPDANPAFASARVFVAPLRFGAGIKGKIGQSMSLGLPVVTTSVGAEGMGMESDVHALVADKASDFAAAVLRLYHDESLWTKIRQNAAHLLAERLGPEKAEAALRDILSP